MAMPRAGLLLRKASRSEARPSPRVWGRGERVRGVPSALSLWVPGSRGEPGRAARVTPLGSGGLGARTTLSASSGRQLGPSHRSGGQGSWSPGVTCLDWGPVHVRVCGRR